jgi:hypothetical protein
MSRVITPAEFEQWLTPGQALKMLSEAHRDPIAVIDGILGRLKAGHLIAASEHSVHEATGERAETRKALSLIDHDDWQEFERSSVFWQIGDGSFVHHNRWSGARTTTSHFNIRFDPAGVRAMLPPTANTPASDSEPELESKGPPVSTAHLKAWYSLYMSIYGGTIEDKEVFAVKSAQGMFPNKFVSRERVRELRGEQKRGPKGPRNSNGEPRK